MALNKRTSPDHTQARFATTHWSVVLTAGDKADSHCAMALQALCQTYWYPLYAYVRHQGYAPQDAEDLIQSFFVFLLEKDRLGSLVEDVGKFRYFLQTALNHFRVDLWKQAKAAKRGGDRRHFRLDMGEGESRFAIEAVDTNTPEKLYDLNWAVTLLDAVFAQLQKEFESQGQAALFETLKFCITGQRNTIPYATMAEKLDMTESHLKVKIHRLRKRYRELLREQIAHTVATPEEVDEEMRSLFQVLAG